MSGELPAGWLPDPTNRFEYRYFNGTAWTSDVASGGRQGFDPLTTPRAPRRRSTIVAFVVGGIVVVAALVIGAVTMVNVTRRIAAEFDTGPADVTVPVCTTRSAMPYAEVSVRNIDTAAHSYRVRLDFTDTSTTAHAVVASVDIAVPSLAPGQSKRYRATAPLPVVRPLGCTFTVRPSIGALP